MDFGYKALYDTEIPTSDLIQDSLSVKLFSNIRVSFRLSLLHFFKFDVDFNFVPLEFTPLKMYLTYTNPIAVARYQTPLTLLFKAGYETKVADFWVSWSKDMFLPKFSFLDYLKGGPIPIPMDITTGFKYNPDLKLYDDPNSKVSLVKTLITDPTLTSWIG